jgi:ATP-binding protein involved in chromosome partitioning
VEVPRRIEVEQGERMVVTWEDGSVTVLDAGALRAACPCAACREPAGIEAMQRTLAGPAVVRIGAARLVGGYAVNLEFAPDGHATGIYPFDLLRSIAAAPGS